MDTISNILPSKLFNKIRFVQLRFIFKKKNKQKLIGFIGSTWRGLIGNTLKSNFCHWKYKKCLKCLVRKTCPYYILYEEHSNEPGFSDLPRPYIFYPVSTNQDKYLMLDVTLLGKGCEYVPHIIMVCEQIGKIGLGKQRVHFDLQVVLQNMLHLGWVKLYEPNKKNKEVVKNNFLLIEWLKNLPDFPKKTPWEIKLQSPLRLRKQKQYLREPDWGWAFVSLARKLLILNKVCGGDDIEKNLWLELKNFLSDPGNSENQIFWYDYKRYSSRQQKKVPMGGIIGRSFIEPPIEQRYVWWQWWNVASIFHLGKGTSMGLGKIKLVV